MEQEPNIHIPWDSIEELLKTHDWNSLSPEQRETMAPFFNEVEYNQAHLLLIQSEALFSEERAIQVPKKSFIRRVPYGIGAAAALALLLSLGYLTLPDQTNQIAYSKSENSSLSDTKNNLASNENSFSEQIKPGTPISVQEESAPNLAESNLKSKQVLTPALESKLEEVPAAEMDLRTKASGIAQGQGFSQPALSESTSARKSRIPADSPPVMAGGLPFVRDSIWKNDTLWLLIKTPTGKDSLLPAFNSKGTVWTRP